MVYAKKLLGGLLVAALVLATVELVLYAVGVRPRTYEDDPFVAFSSQSPLFVENKDGAGGPLMRTSESKLSLFNQQTFSKDKPKGTYRVFCLGGSTTFGRPYEDGTSFSGWLRELLPACDPSLRWEVINAGGISYASYRVAVVMEELLEFEPDLFIVYTGHNEFLERRTYGDAIRRARSPLSPVYMALHKTRIMSGLGHLLRRDKSAPDGTSVLSTEVEARLDKSVGPADYQRSDASTLDIIEHFRFNVERMIDMARSAQADIILITPASNLRSCTPFKSDNLESLDPTQRRQWLSLVTEAATAEGDQALALLAKAERIDPRHAGAAFHEGEVLFSMGKYDEARRAFAKSRDEDICPLRAKTDMISIVRDTAARKGVPLVDFVKILGNRAAHGVPGDDYFIDHVHPTIEGNRLLALSLIQAMTAMGRVTPSGNWDQSAVDMVAEQIESSLDNTKLALALKNQAKVLGWAGKAKDASRLARQALELDSTDAETHYLIGRGHDLRGEHEAAADFYRQAINLNPDLPDVHGALGINLSSRGQHMASIEFFYKAIKLRPEDWRAYDGMAIALMECDRLDQALDCASKAVEISGGSASPLYNKGLILLRLGRKGLAMEHFRLALKQRPDWRLPMQEIKDAETDRR